MRWLRDAPVPMIVDDSEPTRDDATAHTLDVAAAAVPRPLDSVQGRRQRDEIRARLFDTPLLPERIGRYEVLRQLGQGALGVVYAGRDTALDREVAIKVMRSAVADAARLRREAQAMAQLSDPNVAVVYEVGEHDGRTFIAMECVDGVTLRTWQARRSTDEILDAYAQAARGLAAAHRAGLVHRDFKPDNAMVARDGRVRVLDFGLAQTDGVERPPLSSGDGAAALDATLTATGTTLGTPAYMALEQLRGADVDARADQFAFAVALYEALYGKRPFHGGSIRELTAAIQQQRIAPPQSDRQVPPAIHSLLLRALAVDRTRRFADMDALGVALARARAPRRWGPRIMVSTLVVVGGSAIVLAQRAPDPCTAAIEALDPIWSPVIAQDTRTALLRGEALDDLASRRLDEIDARATAWREEARAVCDGDGVELEARRACLDDTRAAITTAAARLRARGKGDGDSEHEVDALPILTLAACAELRRRGAIPSHAAPDDAVAAMEVRSAIDLAIREGAAGNYAAAVGALTPAIARARDLDDAPLLAEALIIEAATEAATGDPQAAERSATEAYEIARAAGHDRLAMRAATDLVHVVGSTHGRREAAEQWARVAEALAPRLPADDPAWARLLVNRGLMRLEQGELEGARVDLEGAVAGFAAAFGPDNIEQRPALSNLAHLAMMAGDSDRARGLLDAAIALHERVEGVDHPEVLAPLINRAIVSTALGRFAEAHADLARAAAICASRDLASELPSVRRNLADLLYEQGEFAAARDEIEQAIAGLAPVHGRTHARVLLAEVELGRILVEQGELERARTIVLEVITVAEAALGVEDAVVGDALLVLAQIELAVDDPAAAWRALERAAPALRGEGGACDGLLWTTLGAEVLLAMGDATTTIDPLERLRSPRSSCALPRARLEFTLARAHAAAGHARAIFGPIAESARDRWRARGPGWRPHADRVDAWLAAPH